LFKKKKVHLKMKIKLLSIISIIIFLVSCKPDVTYLLKPSSETSIYFNNKIVETDSFNILTEEYIFNGGGVAVGDFNNDGASDIFFTGNQVSNKLYLNRNNFKFEDVSKEAKIQSNNKWNTGVAVVDINTDGWLDIYVCAAMNEDKKNMLYVNQGLNKNGIPVFKEMAKAYGIDDDRNSMNATFFDYDQDGLLDLYVLNNEQTHVLPTNYRKKITDGSAISNDRLYKNLGKGNFEDITIKAGIIHEGFGLGIAVADINYDGWPDIHISNDYLTNDLLYINNKNGTFTNKIEDYLKHQSKFSMGSDISDYDNDGYLDIITIDMLGDTNERIKTTIGNTNYLEYILNERYDYQYQYMRNMLHKGNGSDGNYSEIGLMAGIFKTDWSWSPLFMDVDNDGNRDLLITNGFPRDITDKDFGNFSLNVGPYLSPKKILDSIPIVKISNYGYKNKGDWSFEDATENWGLKIPSFSNGAAFADLDQDGDLDYIVNNINDEAFIYENTTNRKKSDNNFLRMSLKGPKSNPLGIGTKIKIHFGSKIQYYEHYLSRGYLSSVEGIAHFGLANIKKIDSILIQWPDGKMEKKFSQNTNNSIVVRYTDSKKPEVAKPKNKIKNKWFANVTESIGTVIISEDFDFDDYSVQATLPHKLTQNGPSIVVGDINGDQLEDVIISSSHGFSPKILIQRKDGSFTTKVMFEEALDKEYEEEDMALFDLDNDGDLDLYLVSGSNQFKENSDNFIDRLFLNDGLGNFTKDTKRIPKISSSGSVVKVMDFNSDGFQDLFVGGRTPSTKYPMPEKSYLLQNKNGYLVDVTDEIAPELRSIGMITDAEWADYNGDKSVDLIVVGELMAVTIFKNNRGIFKKMNGTGLSEFSGWWESIEVKDMDQDGDLDFVVGNIGRNNFYHASAERPYTIVSKDFDANGFLDPIPFSYQINKDGKYESYPLNLWGDINSQSPLFRKKFDYYKDYAKATEQSLFDENELKDALILKGNYDRSAYIENLGNGTFSVHDLPIEAQIAPLNDIILMDINGDNKEDIIAVGNDFGNEIFIGKYDALNGVILLGDGTGSFSSISSLESGFLAPGDAKHIAKVKKSGGGYYFFVTQNKGKLLVYESSLKN